MSSRLSALQTKNDILSIYLTAGFPQLNSTLSLCKALQDAGVDLIEIGFPFSDPLADGPVIQQSSEAAIRNGMTLKNLFTDLATIRQQINIPLILMGYLNPVLQYGVEKFCKDAATVGIDGVILPDLPLLEYQEQFEQTFKQYGLDNILMITPTTSDARIKLIDKASNAFIYAVSSASITGGALTLDAQREKYFQRLQNLKLSHQILVGFGIGDAQSFKMACKYTSGAIVGSAFIKAIQKSADPINAVAPFVRTIRNK